VTIQAGTQLGPYQVTWLIGAGGMGEVYRARDTRLGRIVAIKVLPPRFSNQAELRERFEREAQTISHLNHPNICTLHDVGRQDEIDYLVMEYLEGETLATRLERGPLPLDEALKIAADIGAALDKAHRSGVVHRDLKPANVMLTKNGPKLLDFGLAKLRSGGSQPIPVSVSALPTDAANLTAAGTVLGTLQYMSPEQLEGREADSRADIFAFGSMLYEMLTGRKAFNGKSQVSLMASILEHEPPRMSDLKPVTPRALDDVVAGCLAKNPDDRWQDIRDVVRQLKQIGTQPAVKTEPAAPASKTKLWVMVTTAFLVLSSVLLVLYLRPHKQTAASIIRFEVFPPKDMVFSGG
jgi:eukaryotic-like serine/threonine-protein kinase